MDFSKFIKTPEYQANKTKAAPVVSRKKLIDATASDKLEDRSIILGSTTNINNFNNVKYRWANNMWNIMLGCTWFPEKVDLSKDKLQYSKLTDDEREAYDGTLGYLVFLDSINSYNPDGLKAFITSPEVAALYSRQSMEECIVEGTEVLTRSGWRCIQDVRVGDEILSCDSNLKGYFTKIENMICREVSEPIYKLRSNYVSQDVTKYHRLLLRDRGGNMVDRLAETLVRQGRTSDNIRLDFPCALSSYTSQTQADADLPTWIKLQVAIQADGSIMRSSIEYSEELGRQTMVLQRKPRKLERRVNIIVKKDRKIKLLHKYLQELGIPYDVRITSRDMSSFTFTPPFIVSKVFEDVLTLDMFSQVSARQFILELTKWDGWDYGNDTVGYDTSIKSNADFVQQVATLAGMRNHSFCDKDNRSDKFSDMYRVLFAQGRRWSVRGCVKISNDEVYTGRVYCPTVQGSYFVVRHNGKVSITGNCLHSKSYETMLEEICDPAKKEYIYNYWRENEVLFKRVKNVAQHFDALFENPTLDNFSKGMISMYLLEGLYFYVGFLYFYLLQSRDLMQGSAAMIRYINRDEVNHVIIAANVIKAIRAEKPGVIVDEDIVRLFNEAVESEIEWWHYIIGDKILGMSKESISAYVHYLANKRLGQIGMPHQFPESPNPFKKLEDLADIEGQGSLRENMFETTNTGYQQMGTLKGLGKLTLK